MLQQRQDYRGSQAQHPRRHSAACDSPAGKSYSTNSVVKIDNSWLRRADSKNYHHFFPRSYLKKQGVEDWKANTVVNITIVDDYLNKRAIGAHAPNKYLRDFKNPGLQETMQTHLIDDLNSFGVWEDDYEKFIEKRTARIRAELNTRLHPKV